MSARFRFVEPRICCTIDSPCPAHANMYHAALHAEYVSPGILAFVYGLMVGTVLGVLLTLAARGVAGWWLG